jgi:hypothetical protein
MAKFTAQKTKMSMKIGENTRNHHLISDKCDKLRRFDVSRYLFQLFFRF